MVANVSYISLFLLLGILFPGIFIDKYFKLNLLKSTSISIIKMFVQLSLVGIYLQYIFNYNNPFINTLYLIVMIIVATFSTMKTINLNIKTFFVIFTPMLIIIFGFSLFFNIIILKIGFFEAKYLIPISGMILGNCLNSAIICLNSFLSIFKNKKKEYFYTISLGANKLEALKPYMRDSIKMTLRPGIASMATMGIVKLPGMMTGQILAGSLPLTAIKYQIAIMILIFGAQMYNSFFILMLGSKFFFDDYMRPKEKILN